LNLGRFLEPLIVSSSILYTYPASKMASNITAAKRTYLSSSAISPAKDSSAMSAKSSTSPTEQPSSNQMQNISMNRLLAL